MEVEPIYAALQTVIPPRNQDFDLWPHCMPIRAGTFYFALNAASSINAATSAGWEVMTTCDAPSMTTVFFDFARFAMKSCAAAGIFLSALP